MHSNHNQTKKFTAPHEVHQYEQTKFYEEPEWSCEYADIRGIVGCLKCENPRAKGGNALIVEVKAMYKRENLNMKDESTNKPRKHCIFPGRGAFYTCFNSNLVIEPDTSWLGALKDKPIYNADGSEGGDGCYPGNLAKNFYTTKAVEPSGPTTSPVVRFRFFQILDFEFILILLQKHPH